MSYLGTKPQIATEIADGVVTPADLSTGHPNWDTSGNFGVGTTSPSAPITVGRVNSASEGGQIDLCRSTDNASSWGIDVYGDTSTPSLRFVDNVASSTRMQIDGSGRVTMPYQPAFNVRINANWNTAGFITSWIAIQDPLNLFNTSTGTFTAPVAGWYALTYTAGGSGAVSQDIRVNGTGVRRLEWAAAAGWLWSTVACVVYLNVNDSVRIYHVTGTTYASSTENGFSGYLLG